MLLALEKFIFRADRVTNFTHPLKSHLAAAQRPNKPLLIPQEMLVTRLLLSPWWNSSLPAALMGPLVARMLRSQKLSSMNQTAPVHPVTQQTDFLQMIV